MSRRIAHYAAHDLTRAIIRLDECRSDFLKPSRAEDLDRAFRQLAASLGYTVEPAHAHDPEAAA